MGCICSKCERTNPDYLEVCPICNTKKRFGDNFSTKESYIICKHCGCKITNDNYEMDFCPRCYKKLDDDLYSIPTPSPKKNNDSFKLQNHNFEKYKKQIKAFVESDDTEVELQSFETSGGLFGWFDHNITGKEMNEFTKKLQSLLIEMKEKDVEIVNEFNNVYGAFETLDKEYIKGILTAVKAAETASMQAKEAQKRNEETLKKHNNKFVEIKNKFEDIQRGLKSLDSDLIDLSGYKESDIMIRTSYYI